MAIISNLSKWETEKFIMLIEENKVKFYKTAKAILKNEDDTSDALQEALISMYQNYKELNNKRYFTTWATRIVINKCYDLIRKNQIIANNITMDDNFENTSINAKYDSYEIDEYGINKAINSLNEELKLVTILYYYDDFSIKEISETLDIPSGTVKSRLSKAREKLKEKLEKEEI